MGDFNIAQFIGGIVQGMGKGLTGDKGGGMDMEVIPKKKNAPPVIEMTPSQTAASDVVKGAGTVVAMGQPILSPTAPVAPQNRRQQTNVVSDAEFDDTSTDPPKYDWSGTPIAYGHDLPGEGGWSGRGGRMRQMRTGGVTDPQEPVIVHEGEKVQGLPNGQVIVTPQEEVVDVNQQVAPSPSGTPAPLSADVMMQMQNPQYSEQENVALTTNRGADVTADRPPAMSLPDTVKPGMNDEDGIMNAIQANMEIKPSPWKDLGAALIQAGNNHFNNKNEPIRTWGEIQRDKKVAPLAAKLALVRDAKDRGLKTRLTNAQITKAEGEPERLQTEIDRKNRLADVKEFDSIVNAEYKANVISLGRDRADEVKANNQKMFELRQRGVDQNDERIQILKERNAELKRHALVTEGQTDKRLTLDQQKADQLNKHRVSAQKIAAARKSSDGSPQSQTKLLAAETALKKSVAKAVKDGVMDEDEAQDILSQGVRGYLKGGTRPIDE